MNRFLRQTSYDRPGRQRRLQGRRLGFEALEGRALLSAVSPAGLSAPRDIVVLSQNVYLGADINAIIFPALTGNRDAIIGAVTDIWQDVQATDFPARAEVLAREIAEARPDLIGLQEVSLFRTGVPDGLSGNRNRASRVELDYLDILLDELAEAGVRYKTVVVTNEADVELPGYTTPPSSSQPGVLRDIRMTDRDVILARADLPTSQLKLAGARGANYKTNLVLPIGLTGKSLTVYRGWNSVDVTWGGKQQFRFINTHLEVGDNALFRTVQTIQAGELLTGPARTKLPVILVGDFNSPAEGPDSRTYQLLVGAGFRDAWAETNPGDPGYTYGNAADLLNPEPLTVDPQRIDLVLTRGNFNAVTTERIGEELADRTDSGLWASDHAGVVATISFRPRLLNTTVTATPALVGDTVFAGVV